MFIKNMIVAECQNFAHTNIFVLHVFKVLCAHNYKIHLSIMKNKHKHMIEPVIDTITNSPKILLDAATVVIPQTTYNTANSVAEVPTSAYNYVNNMVGWDISTTILGAGLMATAALTDVVPYIGNVDDPILYPFGALYIDQATQNKPITEATETIFVDKIGGAVRRIVPGMEHIVPEKTTDPVAYAIGGAVASAAVIGTALIALKLTDII